MIVVPNVPFPGEWAADLRISMPLSKSYLASHTPIRGFGTIAGACAFSERVAAKIRRPALHDGISGHLVESLREFVQRNRVINADWVDRIEQFRVRIKEGDPLHPVYVELIIVTLDVPFNAAESKPLRDWRLSQKSTFPAACGGATLLPLRFLPLSTIGVQDYRESFPMRIPELGQQSFW
jgi:hypothetical protein